MPIPYTIDGIRFSLQEPFDFAWLRAYGRVFTVYDQQDSGNLCFGVEKDGEKRFVKLAGARPLRSEVEPEAVVDRLLHTVATQEALRHPRLVDLLEHFPVPGGHAAVFAWFEGTSMGKQYGQFERFLALPLAEKLAIYEGMLDFHRHVNACGYVAIDFYDGSVLYNFETREMMLCDIEFYEKQPVINTMGRMWGSSRYMSPEEFTLGAPIDARTNVFAMGAMAFQLFGGGVERTAADWEAGAARYAVALRAVNPDRAARYPSIDSYWNEWQKAGLPGT